MNQIRTFIAIEIPLSIKEKLEDFQERLKQEKAHISWVKPGNIHITLKFLGDIEENQVNDLENIITHAVVNMNSFRVNIQGVGAFPNYNKPKVLWIGANSEDNRLLKLSKIIDDEIHQLGFEKEKRNFKAHLTIGRVKGITGIGSVITLMKQSSDFEAGFFDVNEITIMKSTLKSSGAIYTPLKKIEFK